MLPTPLPRAFDLLEGHRSTSVDTALLECLPHLASASQTAALRILIERGHLPTLTRLIASFPTLGETARSAIIQNALGLSGGIRSALASDSFDHRAAAVDVILRSSQPHLAYMLADALRHTCPKTRAMAAGALRSIASDHLDKLRTEKRDPSASAAPRTQDLADALKRAVTSWDMHAELEAIEAAMWFADRLESAVRRKLQDPNSSIASAMKKLIQTSSDARLAGFVMRALAIPVLQETAQRRIARGGDEAFIRELVHHSAMLKNEEILRGWRRIRNWDWIYDARDLLAKFHGAKAVGAVRLIAAAGGPHQRKIELLGELLNHGQDDLRSLVLEHLAADGSEAARSLILHVASRSGDPMAQGAARIARGERTHRTAPPTRIDQPPPAAPEPSVTLQDLQVGLAHQEPLVRARALQRLRQVKGVRQMATDVYRLAHDPEPVVRSIAVSLLAELPGATAERILRTAVNDPDERVQANAIEALDRLNADSRVAATATKLTARSSRVRANAVKSLLRTELRQSAETLLDMLEDPSRAHRLSALWVVERLGLGSMLQRVERLSADDPDEQVRHRAQRILRGLIGRHHASSWWHSVARTHEIEDAGGDQA